MDPLLATLRGTHTVRAQEWASRPALVYCIRGSALSQGASGNDLLSDLGWVTTSLLNADGSGADLPDGGWSTLDWGTPGTIGTNATNDKFQSPAIFADPMGFNTAMRLLGSQRPPNKFVAEWWGAFTTDSANETTSGFGLVEAGGSAGTANDRFAWISSNSANLIIGSGAAAGSAVGPAVAQQLLCHRIVLNRADQTLTWFTSTDGITFTQRATLAIETDLLPVSFGMFMGATNSPQLYGDALFYYV